MSGMHKWHTVVFVVFVIGHQLLRQRLRLLLDKRFWFLSSLLCLPLFVTQLPGKKDLFIEADLMSPLDRIANVSTLKVNLIS